MFLINDKKYFPKIHNFAVCCILNVASLVGSQKTRNYILSVWSQHLMFRNLFIEEGYPYFKDGSGEILSLEQIMI